MTTTSEGRGAMDAAARAELDELRRRAYSSNADITGDPAALARLVELEQLLRDPVQVEEEPSAPPMLPEPPAVPAAHEASPRLPQAPRMRRWHAALIGATAAAAAVLGGIAWAAIPPPPGETPLAAVVADALAFANDPDARLLYTLRLDGAFGSFADPYPEAVPTLPIDKPLWASPLGEYYGYDLWIAGTVTPEPTADDDPATADQKVCILLADASTTISRCVTRGAWEQGALVLALGFDDIAPEERPEQMSADQSVGLWWTDDARIRVLLARID